MRIIRPRALIHSQVEKRKLQTSFKPQVMTSQVGPQWPSLFSYPKKFRHYYDFFFAYFMKYLDQLTYFSNFWSWHTYEFKNDSTYEKRQYIVSICQLVNQLTYFNFALVEISKQFKNKKPALSRCLNIIKSSPHCLLCPVGPKKFNGFSGLSKFIEVD